MSLPPSRIGGRVPRRGVVGGGAGGVGGVPVVRGGEAAPLGAHRAQHAPHRHDLEPHVQRRVVPQAHRLCTHKHNNNVIRSKTYMLNESLLLLY